MESMDQKTVPAASPLDTRRGAVLWLAVAAALPLVSAAYTWFLGLIGRVLGEWHTYCLLLRLTGGWVRCPLCGGTRCAGALLRGDFATAVYYNPLVIVGGVAALGLAVRVAVCCLRREYRRPWPRSFTERGLVVVMWALLAFTLVRNLPFYRTVFY